FITKPTESYPLGSDRIVKYRQITNRTKRGYAKTQFCAQHSRSAFPPSFDSSPRSTSKGGDKSRNSHGLRTSHAERRAGARCDGYIAGTEPGPGQFAARQNR